MHLIKYEMQRAEIDLKNGKITYTAAEQKMRKAYDAIRKLGEGWQIGLI
jgi:hypothetical protein